MLSRTERRASDSPSILFSLHSNRTTGLSEQNVWQALLNALSNAGLDYKSIHRVVTLLFVSWECGADSEWLADVTLDRVAQKIHKGEEVRSIVAYSKKFAYLVWLEYCRDREKLRKAMKDWARYAPDRSELEESTDLRRKCQEACLNRLPHDERQLLTEYYLEATDREVLAQNLGLVIATLRTNIHRLKVRLRKCVEVCRRSV